MSAKDIWDEIERQCQQEGYNMSDITKMNNALAMYEDFKQEKDELLKDTYKRYTSVINELKKCGLEKGNAEINMKFIKKLNSDWSLFGIIILTTKEISKLNIHELVGTLMIYQPKVSKVLAERKDVIPADPLALVVKQKNYQNKSSKRFSKIVSISSDSDSSNDDFFSDIDESHHDLIKAASMFIKQLNKTRFRNKSNKNKSSSSSSYYKQADNPKKKTESSSSEAKRDSLCFNCGKSGHFSRECKVPKKKDYEYYKKKMLMAKVVERGGELTKSEDNWFYWTDNEESEEEHVNVCRVTKLIKNKKATESSSNSTSSEEEEM